MSKTENSDFLHIQKFKQQNNNKHLNDLIQKHHKMICSLANFYSGFGMSKDNLIAEGIMGLIIANEKFKPDKDASFKTYLYIWIKARMLSLLNNFVFHNSEKLKKENNSVAKSYKHIIVPDIDETWDGFVNESIDQMYYDKYVSVALIGLSKREKMVLNERWFGLKKKNLADLAQELKCSIETVRRIEKRSNY